MSSDHSVFHKHRCCTVLPLILAAGPALAGLDITGIEGALLHNVRQFADRAPDCEANDRTVESYAARLPDRLRPALEAFGYYQADITAEIGARTDACWRVQTVVRPGPPVRVRDLAVAVTGAAEEDPDMRSLLAAFPLAPGSVLRHAEYLEFKGLLESLARERGYPDGRFAAERIDVYVDAGVADIELEFDSGPRYEFGEVTFDTSALSPEVLQGFVTFEPGQPYDSALIAEMQQELIASDYFAAVNVRSRIDARRERRIPIQVDVTEGRAASWSVGAGYTTDYGPRLRLLHENRRRNTAGHQMRADVLVSPVRQSTVLDYRVPRGRSKSNWWSLQVDREDIDAGTGTAARLGWRRSYAGDDLTVTRFVDVVVERDRVEGEEFSNTLLMPGSSWVRVRRDDLVRPRDGYRLGLDLSAGVGSHVSLLSMELQGKWITTLARDARVLVRGRAGALVADREVDDVPLSMRFFTGGDSNVRGYDYESLGFRDAEGDLIGGDRLLEASVEYEYPVGGSWSAAAFVDAGNAFLAGGAIDVQVGTGLGVRWLSPLGPVRIDVAWPLDGEDRSPRLHLSLGPDL